MSFLKNHSDEVLIASIIGALGVLIGTFFWIVFDRASLLQTVSKAGTIGTARESASLPSAERPAGQTTLEILGDTFSGYSTFRNADFQAALAAAGIELTYADEFDQAARSQLLSSGEVGLMVTTLDQFLQHQPAGKIVGLIDRTVGADAIVLNSQQYPELTSLTKLAPLIQQARQQGKSLSIAFAADTPSEYLALVLDTKFESFNLEDFKLLPLADASEVWQRMQEPQQDIAIGVLWEPFITQASQQGNAVLFSSQDAPQAIIDVVVAADTLLESNPEAVSTFLETYYRRIDASVQDADLLKAQIAADGELSDDEAATIIDGIEFFTAVEAQRWLTDGTLDRRIEATAAVLALTGRINTVPRDTAALISDEPIKIAARNSRMLAEMLENTPEIADRLLGEGQTVAVRPSTAGRDIGNLQVQGRITFEVGTAQLAGDSQKTLNQLAQQIKEFNPATTAVKVIGHTSNSGSPERNLQLSQQRAQTVANYLRQQQVTHQLLVEGKGTSQPLPNLSPKDAANQRTEIRLVRLNEQ
ncbi:MAG: OmpA family protein [Leptolyngbya sp. SIO4C1]|nr:OmpA family protein [Leptolyngbya sp. SIO4C1]